MRLNISDISVSTTIEAETKNLNFRHEYPDSSSGGSIFDKISRIQKYFSRIEIKRIHLNVKTQSDNGYFAHAKSTNHVTQIDIQSSCFILSDSKAQNNVMTADKICLMTSLVNGPKVLKIEFPFILKFEKLLNQPKVDLEVAFFKLEIEIKLFGIISSMIKSNTGSNQNSAIVLQNMNPSDRNRSSLFLFQCQYVS